MFEYLSVSDLIIATIGVILGFQGGYSFAKSKMIKDGIFDNAVAAEIKRREEEGLLKTGKEAEEATAE